MSIFKKVYTIEYKGEKIDIHKRKYSNGRIALQAVTHRSGEPFATLTTNTSSYEDILDKDDILLDCNNVPNIDKILIKAGLVSECLGRIQLGWCTYPVHKWIG